MRYADYLIVLSPRIATAAFAPPGLKPISASAQYASPKAGRVIALRLAAAIDACVLNLS